jgi:hypothetical protein
MPLSSDPQKRANQLANLRAGGRSSTSWKPGAAPHLVHGARSRRPPAVVIDPIVEELRGALEADVPLRGPDGRAPAEDVYLIELAALGLLRVRRCAAFIDLHGDTDVHGNLRPEVDALGRAIEGAARLLDRLGLSPTSRAKLGLTLVRGASEAAALRRSDDFIDLEPDAQGLAHDLLRRFSAAGSGSGGDGGDGDDGGGSDQAEGDEGGVS